MKYRTLKDEYKAEIKALVDQCQDERDVYLIWLYVQHRAPKHMPAPIEGKSIDTYESEAERA